MKFSKYEDLLQLPMDVHAQAFSLVTFICATVWHEFVPLGGGWVQFVSMIAFILTTFLFMLHVFRLTAKLSEQMPFKFIVSPSDASH